MCKSAHTRLTTSRLAIPADTRLSQHPRPPAPNHGNTNHTPSDHTTHFTTSIPTQYHLSVIRLLVSRGLPHLVPAGPPPRNLSTHHCRPHNAAPPSRMTLWTTRDTPDAAIRTQARLMRPDISRSLFSPIPTINFDA